MKPLLIVLQGPTASGKTSLSIQLAKALKTEIISADSRQFYKEISIGTAKPSMEEQAEIKHHFIDSHSIHEPVNAAQFEKEALDLIQNQLSHLKTLIVVGGSGLFIDALTYGLDDLPTDKEVQTKYEYLFQSSGIENLQNLLKDKDPEHYETIDRNNPHRVIRALELIELTGKKISEIRTASQKERPFETLRFVLDLPRSLLYERINQRVDIMVEQGLLEEVQSVQEHSSLQSLNTVGYKEIFAFLNQEITWEEAVDQIKQNTRRYAKRQLTWFRKNQNNIWVSHTEPKAQLEIILTQIQNR